jgi:UDP-N-acetylmuramoyl-tripeptide--D-alanyl-D-alanine ligase
LVGELFAKTTSTHIKFNTFEALKQHIEQSPIMNSSILIKGSRGMALERSIAFL